MVVETRIFRVLGWGLFASIKKDEYEVSFI